MPRLTAPLSPLLAPSLLAALLVFASHASAQISSLETRARENPRDAAAQSAYGEALITAGRYDDARRVLTTASRLAHNSIESLYALARVEFALGDYHRSRNACRALERRERDATLSRVCRARAYLVWNRAARAFEELETAVQDSPDDFEVRLALGDAHRQRGDVAEAETEYQAAARLEADRYEPKLGLGLLYAAAGRQSDARSALEAAHRLAPNNAEVHYQLALAGGGDPRTHLRAAVAERPDWGQAWVALGEAELAAGDLSAARTAFEAGLRANASDASALSGLGQVQMQQEQFTEAEASFQRSLELVPTSAPVALLLGELYERTDRSREAMVQYRSAAGLSPRDPIGLLEAAELAISEDRGVLAAGFLDRYMEVQPRSGRLHYLYGRVMLSRNDRARALEHFQQALGSGEVPDAEIRAQIEAASH